MNFDTALYDWTPIWHLMAMGLVVAAGPLAWLLLRHRGQAPLVRLRALTLLTLFFTFDLVLFGAFTRLTDSGLGCPDWPGCYGNVSPMGARDAIAAAQAVMPSGPVTHGKAWVEMVHRYLATGVGVLIITLLVLTWLHWRRTRQAVGGNVQEHRALSLWWPLATLVWVCLQGAFGAWTVTMRLWPAIVTAHLLGGIGLLVLLTIQAEHYRQAGQPRELITAGGRALMWLCAGLLGAQVALGGWVSTNYAVLACTSFPDCQGSWWPVMDFARGFELWRPLGQGSDGSLLPFAALTAIHYTHRLFAYLVFAALLALFVNLRRQQLLHRHRRLLLGLTVLQLVTGLSNVILDWPLLAALLHTGGAAALMAVLVWMLCASRSRNGKHGRTTAISVAGRDRARSIEQARLAG